MKARRPPASTVGRPPLREVLDAQVDEQRIQRLWRSVEPRVFGVRTGAIDRRLVIGGSVLAAAVVALVYVLRPAAEPAMFLALADGGAPAARAAEQAETVAFADGSHIELGAGAEIVPTLNDADDFALTLTGGVARVAVTPGGPRRWRVDCGLAVVEVVGTEFLLDRSDEGVRVSVERGHVRVTARDERHWDLFAGDEVWVPRPEAPVEAAVLEPEAVATAPVPPEPDVVAITAPARLPVEAPVARSPRWTELAESGAYDRAYDALGDEGGAHEEVAVAAPRELLLLADVARLSGHPSEAVEPLERLISDHAGEPEAPLAAVVLGRLQQDALHSPESAARAFERAQVLGVPASLAVDVEGRLALVYLMLDDPRGLDAARRYLAEHPGGPHAAALASRLE